METLWPRIEPLLWGVSKPARYIGGEQGATLPTHGPGQVSWLLVYPDTYEIGLPNQGLQILYEILNERPDALAERAYAPWTDMEAAMRDAGVPLFSVENHLGARAFDVLAFNLSAELVYTNVLNCIDLAGVPLHAAERGPGDPLVVAGGHCTYNPEPLADFLDALVLGDGEEVVGEMTEVLAAHGGAPDRAGAAGRAGGGRRGLRALPLPLDLPPRAPRGHGARLGGGAGHGGEAHGGRPRRSGPTPSSSWCPSPRWSTTGSTWRCSGAAPAAAVSARPA